MRKLSSILVLALAILSLSANAHAFIFMTSFSGTLDNGDPTWNRTNELMSAISVNTEHYDVQPFWVASTTNYTLQNESNFDSYIFLYENSFDPTDALSNFVAGDDDDGTAPNVFDSFVGPLTLNTNTQYFYVTSQFDPTDFGDYENTIEGEGEIYLGLLPPPDDPPNGDPNAIPEPATMLLFGSGMLGAFVRKRKT